MDHFQVVATFEDSYVPHPTEISLVKQRGSKVVSVAFGRNHEETTGIFALRRTGMKSWTKHLLDAERSYR